jgi:hypothetical protein
MCTVFFFSGDVIKSLINKDTIFTSVHIWFPFIFLNAYEQMFSLPHEIWGIMDNDRSYNFALQGAMHQQPLLTNCTYGYWYNFVFVQLTHITGFPHTRENRKKPGNFMSYTPGREMPLKIKKMAKTGRLLKFVLSFLIKHG